MALITPSLRMLILSQWRLPSLPFPCLIPSSSPQTFIDAEDSVGTLFRGNSLATKAMDQYMKIVAIEYLQNTIGEQITAICEDKRSCEMDPARCAKPADNFKVRLTLELEPSSPCPAGGVTCADC